LSERRALSDSERLDWLRLIRTDQVGPATFFQLIRRFGSASAALEALPDLAKRRGRSGLKICSRDAAEQERARAAATDAHLIGRFEPGYPQALAALDDAPPVLFIRGAADTLTRPMVAIVGARNASANGVRFARQLASDLGDAGFVVASGLARGIDTAAHRGALATGTVAAMAGGIDVVYPPENQSLYEDIVAGGGAAVSEMPPGLQPRERHFPRRNRLVSGMVLGVVVVEAALKSGSLITARLAADQGREVFAVPGSPLDPRARGSNDLLRQGATLTETAADVLAALRAGLPAPPAETFYQGPELSGQVPETDIELAVPRVLEKLSPTPAQVDEIIRQCHLPTAVVHMVLLELELAGRLTRHSGNMVSLAESMT
jgi:DNA processing protein